MHSEQAPCYACVFMKFRPASRTREFYQSLVEPAGGHNLQLYSITTNQAAIAALFRVVNRYVGNLAPMPGVFPDYPAPVIRNTDTGTEKTLMRWGMPPPPRTGGPPVTDIRNTSSPHWRGWLKPKNRCLVPFNSFAEYAPEPNPETKKKDVVWFALNDDRPLTAFCWHLDDVQR
jgi:putative SOS response-associated peptidase YedK